MPGDGRDLNRLIAYFETLGHVGGSQTVPELLLALSHPEPLVRQAASTSLGRIADAGAVSGLLDSLHDPDPGVRQTAAWSLGQIGDWRATDGLLEALQDSHADIRRAAAWALGRLGDRRALPGLRAAHRDRDEGVRRAAVKASETFDGIHVHEVEAIPAGLSGIPLASHSRYRRRKRSPIASRLLDYGLRAGLVVLGLAVLGIVVILAITILNWNRSLGPGLVALETSGTEESVETPVGEPICGGPSVMMLLLVGSDAQSSDFSDGFADVIRIARVDFVASSVVLLAVPRDLWVPIPGLESHGIVNNRLKTAYTYGEAYDVPGGGPSLLAQTLALNFGLRAEHYVIITFAAFEKGIDAVGGVDVYLPERVESETPGGLAFPAGWQHMDGRTALSYARFRPDNSSDLGRIERQTHVIAALRDKVSTTSVLAVLPDLISSLQGSARTDLSPAEVSALMCLGRHIGSDDIRTLTIEGEMVISVIDEYGHERLLPNSEAIRRFVLAFSTGQSTFDGLPLDGQP
ncbi:MAG: LCP family protein [Anaerolineae bacterium]|nr:LCP family protein [Anaerolineae bacterium]